MRETRHLWIGNLPENTREEGIVQHFKKYGKIDKVRFLPKRNGDSELCACVAFMDIRSAQKAKAAVNTLSDRELVTDYFDPSARSTSTPSDEGQKQNQSQARTASSRRYESHRDSKRMTDVTVKEKKKHRRKNEDGKMKQKSHKERGRSQTGKRKKSFHGSATSSPVGGKPEKHSSSEGRSSSSGSGSRSTSRSKRSSSASSTSSTGSSNSTKTPNSHSQSNSESSYEVEGPDTRKMGAMCVRKLPLRPTATSLRDGIFHEFKKYGKVKSVMVRGDGLERHAIVLFRTGAEADRAVAHAKNKLLFGAAIEASIYEGEVSGQELEECGGIIDEFHPRASRTLFVGNLDKTVGYSDIQNIFVRFGEIVAIEIKKQHNIPQYAFLQYTDIISVVRAITKMDGEKLGRNTLKLGFGKTVMSSCLWVDGVTDSFTENYLASCFQRYGPVKHVVIDRNRSQALVFYSQYDYAQAAMAKMRARKLNGSRLKLDYASNELIEIFLKHMQNSGQSIQGLENIRQLMQPPSSPTAVSTVTGSSYSRSSINPDSRSYYDDRSQSTYPEDQYGNSEGSYRRGWRGRSRERYVYSVEQSSHNRQKRTYDEPYERSDYHRDQPWTHDGYEGSRRTSHYDQDYRQRDYDIRREQRPYSRKPSRGSAPYDDSYHYRGARDRSRDDRDVERDRAGDRYFSRSGQHLSPSHPRFVSRRSRSLSPHPRDTERYSLERTNADTVYRRHGRSGSRTPDFQPDSIRRRNSMESKSPSHSSSRYTARTGDVDMREYLDDEKLSVTSQHGDERIVEYSEKAKKLRVRKRITTPESREDTGSPKHRHDYRSGSETRDASSLDRQPMVETFEDSTWVSESSNYSDNNRSRSGTPTRDENQDLIGEVIIKQPSKTSSRISEKVRLRSEGKSSSSRKEKQKPRDKDYRKAYSQPSESLKGENVKPVRSSSSSLIQRVHSPSETERKASQSYTKDFDYRKQAVVRSSKSGRESSSSKYKTSRSIGSRHDDVRPRRTRNDFDDCVSNSPPSLSPSSEKSRQRPLGSSSLLKREYSPRPDEEDKLPPAKIRKNSDRSKQEVERRRHTKERGRGSGRERESEGTKDIDERRSYAQKRRHSADLEDDEDKSGITVKRERKASSGDYSRHKPSHHQSSQKHEAPMSIARQMFLEEEERESGAESPAVPKPILDEEIQEEIILSKTEELDDKPTSAEQSPTREFSNAALVAAQSLLPKRLPKIAPKASDKTVQIEEKKTRARKDDGNLTELEKEKERLQQLLSKLDKEKQLDVKDAGEVAEVVLQELTEKARSKILSSKSAKQPAEKPSASEATEKQSHSEATEKLSHFEATEKQKVDKASKPKSKPLVEQVEEVEHTGFSCDGDDVTVEEEIVLDTIEEVTVDEVVETEVEEVAIKEEEIEVELEIHAEEERLSFEEPAPATKEIPLPVVPVTKSEEYDHTQGYRKQMEARKKELEKLEKKKEHERKKLLKKQEKEKKKQMKRVQAMRGPSQTVISSVDDEAINSDADADGVDADATTPDVTTPTQTADESKPNQTEAMQHEDMNPISDKEAKNDETTSLTGEVDATDTSDVVISGAEIVEEAKNRDLDLKQQQSNPDLERPWPPDKDNPPLTNMQPTEAVNVDHADYTSSVEQTEKRNVSDSKNTNSNRDVSPITPGSGETSLGSTPLILGKEPSPKGATVGITPTSSVSLKSSLATPTTTPSQSTRTPSFTTPSPASTSSTSSSKSQQRQKQMKKAAPPPHHPRPGQNLSRRPSQHGRPEPHSRLHGNQNSDHRRRSSHQGQRSSSSSSHGFKMKPEGKKKSIVPLSRRPMATITVGLDASPSKPLGKSELEKLRLELESVRNQLDLDMSPSSLSPCSGDEGPGGKSPAQLLSPLSPVLKSPADFAPAKRMDNAATVVPSGVSPSSTPTLTDRLKLLGRVKKKTPSVNPDVKAVSNNSLMVQQDRDVEFRQSRIFRSSIFDQDSERLSHVCRQLDGDKVEMDQNMNVTPSVVPLFSGSKFLDPTSFTGTILSSSSIPSVPSSQAPAVTIPTDATTKNDQPQLSSIDGPKNVLSLSRSELPATAERKQHDFAGKNCNVSTPDLLTSDIRKRDVSSAAENTSETTTVTVSNMLPYLKQEQASRDQTNSDNQSHQPPSVHPPITFANDKEEHENPKIEMRTGFDPEASFKSCEVNSTKPQDEPPYSESHFLDDAKPDSEAIIEESHSDAKVLEAEITECSSSNFIGEVVGDIDVFPGTCMEISESTTGMETGDVVEHGHVVSEEMVPHVLGSAGECNNPSHGNDTDQEKKCLEEQITAESEKGIIAEKSLTDANGEKKDASVVEELVTSVNESKKSEAMDAVNTDRPETKLGKIAKSTSKSESQHTTVQSNTNDSKSVTDTASTEVKPKMKQAGKVSKKTADATKDLKKVKRIGKHKSGQKESKTGVVDSSTKKEGLKRQKCDESNKQGDSQSLSQNKERKVKSEGDKSTKSKYASEKGGSKSVDKENASSVQSSKPVSSSKNLAPEGGITSDKKDSKVGKSLKVDVAEDAVDEKSTEPPEPTLKIKPKELPLKEKKLLKEGKKEKKAVPEKKSGLYSDAKADSKKLKKKVEKPVGEKTSENPTQQKAEGKKKDKGDEASSTETVENAPEKLTAGGKASSSQVKTSLHASKTDNKDIKEEVPAIKKKKKKKHLSEKEKSKSSTTADRKTVKHPSDGANPLSDVSSKSIQETKRTGEKLDKVKKSSKSTFEKQKHAEGKSHDKESSKSGSVKTKKDSSKTLSDKSLKKDPLKKFAKAHADLRPSHSFPGKSNQKKEEATSSVKKSKKSKFGKSSSMSPGSRKQSRYSQVYSDSSSEDSDGSVTPSSSVKRSVNQGDEDKSSKKVDKDKSAKGLAKSDDNDQNQSKWPGLADDMERERSFQRHWSSSSSSVSDSAGPPPVVSSSLLVTETIKNETILPEGYTEQGFTDSSDEEVEKQKQEKEIDAPAPRPFTQPKPSERKVKKKFGNVELRKSPKKEKQKAAEHVKSSSRLIIWSSSGSDSSDGDLIISMNSSDLSGASDQEREPSAKPKVPKIDANLKRNENRSRALTLGLDLSSSDEEEASKATQVEAPKAKEVVQKTKKPLDSKDPKISSSKEKSSKHAPLSKKIFDSESSDNDGPIFEKRKKKKSKPDKESGKSKDKNTEQPQLSHFSRKKDDHLKLKEVSKKSEKGLKISDSSSSDSDIVEKFDLKSAPKPRDSAGISKKTSSHKTDDFSKVKDFAARKVEKNVENSDLSSDAEMAEKSMPKHNPKSKNPAEISKKNPASKLPSKSKVPSTHQASKSTLEKTKSDSKTIKSLQKSHDKKDKLKSKSHSLDKLPSQGGKLKESHQKRPDVKPVSEHSAQENPRPSSKDRLKGDKDAPSKQETNKEAESTATSSTSNQPHKLKQQKPSIAATSTTSANETKSQSKEAGHTSDKHPKKSSKEGKRSEKKDMMAALGKSGKSEKEKAKSSSKQSDSSRSEKHLKKKKKKSHKKEMKDVGKVAAEKQQELLEKIPVKPSPIEKRQKPNEKEEKVLARSVFSSDSDDNDDDFEMVEEAPIPAQQPVPSTTHQAGRDLDSSSNEKQKDVCYSGPAEDSKDNMEESVLVSKEKPIVKESSTRNSDMIETQKISEKLRMSGEGGFLSSTSDESDIEQKLAVQSAISSLERDDDVEQASDTRTTKDTLSESDLSAKTPKAKPEVVETESSVLGISSSVQPSKRFDASEQLEKKNKSEKPKECMVKQEAVVQSPSVLPQSGLQMSKHNLHYGVKGRREKMDKMKSVSHERDEEAVRSIMGILDESSDADSYFSDVKPDELPPVDPSSVGEKTPDRDRSARRSKDSDVSSGYEKTAPTAESKFGGITTENNSSLRDTDGETEEQSDVQEERTMAEQNELAAAVSSIEGLFGDFGDKPSDYEDFASSQSGTYSERCSDAGDTLLKKEESASEHEALSQEEVEKSCEEAALAASTLLAESREESFYGFQTTPVCDISSNKNKALIGTDNEIPENTTTTEGSLDFKLPSVRDDPVAHTELEPPPASISITDSSVGTLSNSRKRHRDSREKGSSGRDSDRSDNAMSESETPLSETSAKQRKIADRPDASGHLHNFDADVNSNLAEAKSETSAGNLPFVCATTSPQPLMQTTFAPSVSSSAAPFVSVSVAPAVTEVVPSSSSGFGSTIVQLMQETPSEQPSKLSRDLDTGGNMTGATAKRRPSSSSSSTAATSPTRGSQMPQLTPVALNNSSQSFGGMQMHGPAVYAPHNAPFLSPPSSTVTMTMPVHHNVPEHSGPHPFPVPYPVANSMAMTSTTPSIPQLPQGSPFHVQPNTQQVVQGYHPHLPPQVPAMYSVRPAHPAAGSNQSALYGQQSSLIATNVQRMPGHTNIKMQSPDTGSQLGPKSNIPVSLATPSSALSFPTSSSASVTSPTQRQGQFVHHQPSGTASKPMEFSQSVQYHVGVPTYPHRTSHQPSTVPATQPSPQRAPAPQEPVVTHHEQTQKPVARQSFPHPQVPLAGPLYQPHMYAVQGQISPQALGQSPFAVQSPTRPPTSQISPTVTAASAQVAHDKMQSGLQIPPSNTFMQQQFPQVPPSQQRPTASPQLKPADVQRNVTQQLQPPAEKTEGTQSSNAASNPSQGAPAQAIYRKLESTQHLPGAQPGLSPFGHPSLYYPTALHGFPPYPPGIPYMLRPGMPPTSVVHPAQLSEMARQQQLVQIPQQRMSAEKHPAQPFATQPQAPARKEQAAPAQSSKASPAPRDSSHSIRVPYGIPTQSHVQSVPQMPYQPYGTSSAGSHHLHPHQTEHGDRVVRAPSDQDQADMVDQHFRRCLVEKTTPARSHPTPAVSTSANTESQRYVGQQKAEQLAPAPQHPALNPQLGPGLNFPASIPLAPGMRYPVPAQHHMWPRPGANFRPPPVPTVSSQQPTYLPGQGSTHMDLQNPLSEQLARIPPISHESHSPLPQSVKSQPTSSQPNDQVMTLFKRYPIIWQGLLALRKDSAAIQAHFICGDHTLAQEFLPHPDAQNETDKERNLAVLRIVQRMRLEPSQLEGIDKRMMTNSDFCLLLALPCGRDENDVITQQNALKEGFINYLKQKQAAGIVNIQNQQSQSGVQYVLHVFPPCDFTTKHLQLRAQDLLSNINDIQHIMIVIAAINDNRIS